MLKHQAPIQGLLQPKQNRPRSPLVTSVAATFFAALLLVSNSSAVAIGSDLDTLLDSDDAATQTQWAQRYEHGEGVAQNFDHAVLLYCRAAQAGDAIARYQLGWMYVNGRGVERNDRQAAAWFKLAAQQGDQHAERILKRLPTAIAEAQCVRPNGIIVEPALTTEPDPSQALIVRWVRKLAPKYRLDPALVLAVIRAESNFNPKARSPKNAQGLMQLIPATATRFDVSDVWDPLENIRGGMAYLRWLLDHFKGDESLALAGYNAGENAVHRYKGIPPYPETRSYVKRVSLWRKQPVPRPPTPPRRAPKPDNPA